MLFRTGLRHALDVLCYSIAGLSRCYPSLYVTVALTGNLQPHSSTGPGPVELSMHEGLAAAHGLICGIVALASSSSTLLAAAAAAASSRCYSVGCCCCCCCSYCRCCKIAVVAVESRLRTESRLVTLRKNRYCLLVDSTDLTPPQQKPALSLRAAKGNMNMSMLRTMMSGFLLILGLGLEGEIPLFVCVCVCVFFFFGP